MKRLGQSVASRTTNKSFVLFPGGPFFRLNSWKYVEIKIASSEEVLSPRNNLISKVSDKQEINVRNWVKKKVWRLVCLHSTLEKWSPAQTNNPCWTQTKTKARTKSKTWGFVGTSLPLLGWGRKGESWEGWKVLRSPLLQYPKLRILLALMREQNLLWPNKSSSGNFHLLVGLSYWPGQAPPTLPT